MRKPPFFLCHTIAVDGGPVVRHGNGNPTKLITEAVHFVGLHFTAVFTDGIIAAEHEGETLIGIVAGDIHCHAGIICAGAEGENRLNADLLDDHDDFVHLEVLDQKIIAEDQSVIFVVHIIRTVGISLVRSHQGFIGTYDLMFRNIKRGITGDLKNNEAVSAADNIYGEVVGLEVICDLDMGLYQPSPRFIPLQLGMGSFLNS